MVYVHCKAILFVLFIMNIRHFSIFKSIFNLLSYADLPLLESIETEQYSFNQVSNFTVSSK